MLTKLGLNPRTSLQFPQSESERIYGIAHSTNVLCVSNRERERERESVALLSEHRMSLQVSNQPSYTVGKLAKRRLCEIANNTLYAVMYVEKHLKRNESEKLGKIRNPGSGKKRDAFFRALLSYHTYFQCILPDDVLHDTHFHPGVKKEMAREKPSEE